MKIFFFEFMGRELGAIGILYNYCREIKASSYNEAVLKLYETHEHISIIHWAEHEVK